MTELTNLKNLHLEKLRLEKFTKTFAHENLFAKDYASGSHDEFDDRAGITSQENQMLIRRVINTGLREVSKVLKTSPKVMFIVREEMSYAKVLNL